jgi:hypothetical protein
MYVCMSAATFVVSFLNGFGWNFGDKFGILFSLTYQIYNKFEHFYLFYYSRIIWSFDLFQCIMLPKYIII